LQLIVSGSFWVPEGEAPQPKYLDHIYQKTVTFHGKNQVRRRYYLNFGKIADKRQVAKLMERFVNAINPQKELFGYMLDIDTFIYFLEDSTTLGSATRIKFRFGMNLSGKNPSNLSNARMMMIAITDADPTSTACVFYLDNLAALPNDGESNVMTCPPRTPCDAPKPNQ